MICVPPVYVQLEPCPKCGNPIRQDRYCTASTEPGMFGMPWLHAAWIDAGYLPHMHRVCGRCAYEQITRPADAAPDDYTDEEIEIRRRREAAAFEARINQSTRTPAAAPSVLDDFDLDAEEPRLGRRQRGRHRKT